MQPELDPDFLKYAERFMELMIDLQALLPTRRYLNILIDDLHLVVRCQMSPILEHGDGHLFSQLLDRLKFYANFEICNESGDSMNELEVMQEHYNKITALQVGTTVKLLDFFPPLHPIDKFDKFKLFLIFYIGKVVRKRT